MEWYIKQPFLLGLLLLFTVSAIDSKECKIGCHGSSGNILHFEPGKVYNYKLEGNSVTTLDSSKGDVSRLGITADVQVSVLKSCEHVLKVTNVHTSGTDSKKYNLNNLSQQPVKFGIQNGKIESRICANDAEDNVGLNIKRAVLSLLQSAVLKENGHASQSETDIFGTCPTSFSFSKGGGGVTVIKYKDLDKCAHRESLTLPFLSTPYYIKSDIQSSSILSSSLRSEQRIESGIVKSAKLEENYKYAPSEAASSTLKLNVHTKLTFVNSAPGAIPAHCTEPQSIIFEQEHAQEGYQISNKIVDLVRQGCESRIIGQDTAAKFSQLVRTIQSATKTDINYALQHIRSGPGIKDRNTAQRMLLDGILMAQSAGSVEVMAEMLKKKEVVGEEARVWLLSLGAVKHASRASLTAVLPLLDGEPDVSAYLGIGSLAGKYCRDHTCDGVNEVNQLQIKLGAPLFKGCKCSNKKEEDQIIASLKGLGNVKYLGPKISAKIIECAKDEHAPNRVRVVALETIATDPNKEQFKTLNLNILKNTAEDSELRIKAYIALAKCPCGKVSGAIKDLLAHEKSNQVGGYITSHLRNLRASTNPNKEAARHHLGNIVPPVRFPIDPKRYSLNQELSYSADIINTGGSAEVDLIYSQNAYLPRSLGLNLTVQLFGTAYNLLEANARAENFEQFAESIFGPKGNLMKGDLESLRQGFAATTSNILEKIASRYDEALRPKRSITRSQLNKIANKVHLPNDGNDVDLDLSLKVLGSEVSWTPLHASELAGKSDQEIINERFGPLDSLINSLQNFDIDWRRHISILDSEITYPTGMGLALKLKTIGTAALRAKLDGKIDIPAILKDPDNLDIKYQIIPSVAVNIGGELTVDGVAVETGIRADWNIHSSTGADLTLRVLNGYGVDVTFGLPLPKQEVISVKSEINSIVRDDKYSISLIPIKFDSKRESYSGCFDQLSPLLGLVFCGDISGPYEQGKPFSPLNGPINLAVSIDKEDQTLTKYHFKALYDYNEEFNGHSVEILWDTPNCAVDRKVYLLYKGSLSYPNRFVDIIVQSPLTRSAFSASIMQSSSEESINARLDYDGQEYAIRLGAKKSGSRNEIKYDPIFEYTAPEPTKTSLIGKKGVQKPKDQSFKAIGYVIMDRSKQEPVFLFKGLGISTPRTNYVVDGTATMYLAKVNGKGDGLSADLRISYEKEHVTIKGKMMAQRDEIHGNLEAAPSQYPDLGVSVALDLVVNKPDQGDNELTLVVVHGPDPKSEVSRIYIHSKSELNYQDNNIISMKFVDQVSYPVIGLEGEARLEISKKAYLIASRGKFDTYSYKVQGGIAIDQKSEGDYKVYLDLGLMGNELEFHTSRDIINKHKSKFTNKLALKPGGTYQANAVIVHNYASVNKHDLAIDADVSMPNEPGLILSAASYADESGFKNKIKLDLGKQCFVDAFSNMKTPNNDFNFKLHVPGYLESEGHLKLDGNNLNGLATLNLPKSDRQAEASAHFNFKDPKITGTILILYDKKDPKKLIKFETDAIREGKREDREGISITSRNKLSYDDYEIKINSKLKGTKKSPFEATGLSELEVILPDGNSFGGKMLESYNIGGENKEFEELLELFYKPKDRSPEILKLSTVAKHIDLDEGTIDGHASISYIVGNGKEARAHVSLKKMPNSNQKTSNINAGIGLSGELAPIPLLFNLESEVSNNYFDLEELLEDELPLINYKVSGHFGHDVKFDGNGKLNGPTISNELRVALPNAEDIKKIQISANSFIDINEDMKKDDKVKLSYAIHWNEDRFVEAHFEGESGEKGILFATEYEADDVPKRRLTGSAYLSDDDGFKGRASLGIRVANESIDFSVKGTIDDDDKSNWFNFMVITSGNGGEKNEIDIRNKVIRNGQGLNSVIVLSENNDDLVANGTFVLESDHLLIDIIVDPPNHKMSKLFYKANKKGKSHYTSELKAVWPKDKDGQHSTHFNHEANLESIDNFSVKLNIDSTLMAKKVHAEIANRPTKGDTKKITFQVKEDDVVVISGSTNYNLKEEKNLITFEGNGNIKIHNKTYPLNFQVTRQILDNGGISDKYSFKGGKITLNGLFKVTEEEYTMERTLCYELEKNKKKCTTGQFTNKLIRGDDSEEHTVILKIDLLTLIDSLIIELVEQPQTIKDISYKSHYKRDKHTMDHKVEFDWGKDNLLEGHSYSNEKATGVFLKFPKRTMGGEIIYDIKSRESAVNFKIEADLYINKGKEPKLALIASSTSQYENGVATIAGETRLSHPAFGKDFLARGQVAVSEKPSKLVDGILEVDVLTGSNNKFIGKLTVSGGKDNYHTFATLKNKGCHIDLAYEEVYKYQLNENNQVDYYLYSESFTYVDSKNQKRQLLAKVEATPKKLYSVLKLPEALVEGDFKFDGGYSGKMTLFGRTYYDSLIFDRNENVFKYNLKGLADGKSLTVEAGGKVGKTAVLRASLDNKKACDFQVNLKEDNFLKSAYSYDTEVLKTIYSVLVEDVAIFGRDCSKGLEDIYAREVEEVKHFLGCIERALPSTKTLEKYYNDQRAQIKDEIEKYPITILLVNNPIASSIIGISQGITEIFRSLEMLVVETLRALRSAFNEVEPELRKSLEIVLKSFNELMEAYLKLSTEIVNSALDELKKNEEDIKVLTKSILELIEEIGQQLGQLMLTLDRELEEFLSQNIQQLQDLPIVAAIEEKLEELKDLEIPEELIGLYIELAEFIKQLAPTKEVSEFLESSSAVIEKILRNEKIKNEDEVIKKLYKELIAAVKSIIALIAESVPKTGVLKPTSTKVEYPFLSLLATIPSGGLRVSLINYLESEEFLPTLIGILSGLRLSLNPLDNIPPYRGVGFIIGGTEVITFDGVHHSVPPLCTYVLSEDYRDRNFSVVAQAVKGSLKSITVTSSNDIIEITHSGHVLVNGKESSLPRVSGELTTWSNPASVGVSSRAGVVVICSKTLDSCMIKVSGFYWGKVRGLLGNLNAEQYDDNLTPDGKIITNDSGFASAWKLDGSCSGTPSARKASRSSQCTEFFNDELTSLMCRPFVNPAPYRAACDHLHSNKKTAGGCLAMQAYTSICRFHGIKLAEVPDACASCEVNGRTLPVGLSERVSVGGAADVVIMAELLKDNEDNYKQIVIPLIKELKNAFEKKSCTDVRVILVGGNSPRTDYPAYFTNKQGKVGFDPASNELWFDERPVDHNETIVDQLRLVYNAILKETPYYPRTVAYRDILETPFIFRPQAYKLIIGVHGEPCNKVPTIGDVAKAIIKMVELEEYGIQYHAILPFSGVEENGKEVRAAVVHELDSILDNGEVADSTEYNGFDVCVVTALESRGSAISSELVKASPKKAKLIQMAATAMVSTITDASKDVTCECSLWKGIIPHPECSVLE